MISAAKKYLKKDGRMGDKMKKRQLCLMMAFVLLLTTNACSKKEETKTSQDTFSMTNVSSYDEMDLLKTLELKNPGMRFGIDTKDQLHLGERRENDSFQIIADSSGKKLQEFKNEDQGGFLIALDSKDSSYFVNQKYSPENQGDKSREVSYSVDVYDANGTKQKSLDLGKRKYTDQQVGISDIAVDSQGNIYLLTRREKIEVLNPEGKKIKDIEAKKADSLETDWEGNFYVGSFDGLNGHSFIEKRSLEKEESLWTKELGAGHYMTNFKFNPADGILYVLTNKGILSCSADGKMQGYIFDLIQSSLTEARIYINDFGVDSNKNFYILAVKSDLSSEAPANTFFLYKYSKAGEKTEVNKDKKSLTIAIRYSDGFMQSAISGFQRAHPELNVVIKDYSVAITGTSTDGPSDDEIKRAAKAQEDFRKITGTELMAGQGPDIIDVMGLPLKNYMDKNVLADLSDLMKNDKAFDANGYLTNILDACKYKDKLCIMPVNFTFTLMAANKGMMDREKISFDSTKWTWEDFISIAEKITKHKSKDGKTEQYALPKTSASEIFGYLFNDEITRFIDTENKTSKFDSKEFIDILKTAKDIYDKGYCSPELDITALYKFTDPGSIGFMSCFLMTYQSVIQQQALFNGEIQLLDMPSMTGTGGSNKSFTPGSAFAINNSSKSKAEAWEFMKYLISEEVQSNPEMYSFPINKAALKQKAKTELAENYMYKSFQTQGREVKALTQADVDQMDKLISQLKVMPYMDTQALEIVFESITGFLSGKGSAEETAKQVQNKVNIYLNE